jgi:FtsP/CotA-like multicopper oxidase with cupredoxin domain
LKIPNLGHFGELLPLDGEATYSDKKRYHSHSELQRGDGLFGGLVVHNPFEKSSSEPSKSSYDDEVLLMIGDWYHREAEEVQASYVTHDSWGREVCRFPNIYFSEKHLTAILASS